MVTDNRTCYFPDGGEAGDSVPCQSDTNTWCCGPGDLCLDNGLCLNVGHQPYVLSRGACTSKAWTGCTAHCKNSNPTGGASISNVYFKNGISTYCCGSPISDGSSITCPADSDNDGVPFPVASGSVIAGRALLANVSSLKVTSSSDGNDTSNSGYATSTATCKACHEAAIGAGVGVPLFVLALSFLIWAIFERARTSRLKRNMVATTTIAVDGSQLYRIPGGTGKRRAMTELEATNTPHRELDG